MAKTNAEANLKLLANRALEKEAELTRIERDAIARFTGQFDDLEAALGAPHGALLRMASLGTYP